MVKFFVKLRKLFSQNKLRNWNLWSKNYQAVNGKIQSGFLSLRIYVWYWNNDTWWIWLNLLKCKWSFVKTFISLQQNNAVASSMLSDAISSNNVNFWCNKFENFYHFMWSIILNVFTEVLLGTPQTTHHGKVADLYRLP